MKLGDLKFWLAPAEGQEAFQVKVLIPVLVIAVFAVMLPWVLQFTTGRISRFDLFALPTMALVFFACAICLKLRASAANAVVILIMFTLGAYELVDFALVSLPFIMTSSQASIGVLWISVIFMMTFLTFSETIAAFLSIAYVIVVILIVAIQTRFKFNDLQSEIFITILLFNAIVIGFLWMFSRIRESLKTMEIMANTDSLTELNNRRAMQTKLDKTHLLTKPYAIVILDIDHFKLVNDTHGHDRGDQVLRELAFVLANQIRGSDSVARWGGEEFLVLFANIKPIDADMASNRLLLAVRQANLAGLQITVSIGLAYHDPDDSQGLEQVTAQADAALYRAKNAGRDQVAK